MDLWSTYRDPKRIKKICQLLESQISLKIHLELIEYHQHFGLEHAGKAKVPNSNVYHYGMLRIIIIFMILQILFIERINDVLRSAIYQFYLNHKITFNFYLPS